MTAVAAIVRYGTAYMGGDSATLFEGCLDLFTLRSSKVHRIGEMLIGVSGSTRWGTVIRDHYQPDEPRMGDTPRQYIARVVEELRALANEHEVLSSKAPAQTSNSLMLIGYRGELFIVDGAFGLCEPAGDMAAAGCGDQVAYGAMHALEQLEPPVEPKRMVEIALEAAERCSAGVRGPFTIEVLEPSA